MGIEIDMTINILKEKAKVNLRSHIYIFLSTTFVFLAVMLLMNYFYGMILLYIAGGIC